MTNAEIVQGVRDGDEAAMLALYAWCQKVPRYRISRSFGPDQLEDRIHNVFVRAVTYLRRCEMREPSALPGVMERITACEICDGFEDHSARRKELGESYFELVADHSQWKDRARDKFRLSSSVLEIEEKLAVAERDAETEAIEQERVAVAHEALRKLNALDRTILIRFYVHEDSREKLESELGMTETQFRLRKYRAKAKFGKAGQKLMQRRAAA